MCTKESVGVGQLRFLYIGAEYGPKKMCHQNRRTIEIHLAVIFCTRGICSGNLSPNVTIDTILL